VDSFSRANARRIIRKILLDLPKDKLSHSLVLFREKVYKHTRFALWFKFLILFPSVIWLILFNAYVDIPVSIRPKIDVTTLPTLESFILLGYSLQ